MKTNFINVACAYCGDFLDTASDECYEENTWVDLVKVAKIDNHVADDIIYCSKSCYEKEEKSIEEAL